MGGSGVQFIAFIVLVAIVLATGFGALAQSVAPGAL
jgi:hypothetical protein